MIDCHQCLKYLVIFLTFVGLSACKTTESVEGAVKLEIMQDLKLQPGTGAPKEVKNGETISINEPVVLSSTGFYPMTIVPAHAGRANLQIKLVKQSANETGDPQKSANALLGDVFRIQTLIAQGKGSQALTLVEETQKNWPRVSFLSYLKASSLVVSKDYDRALTVIDEALTKDSDSRELKELKAQLIRKN